MGRQFIAECFPVTRVSSSIEKRSRSALKMYGYVHFSAYIRYTPTGTWAGYRQPEELIPIGTPHSGSFVD